MAGHPGDDAGSDAPGLCRQKAMDLLARRPHFRAELATKLARRGFESEVVSATCDWLEGLSYLDDRAAAERLVRGALARKGYGPLRMRAELVRRGVTGDVIDHTLAEAWKDGEDRRALEVARARAESRGFDRGRIGRHLGSKGYGAAAIRRALERVGKELGES